MNNVCVLLKNNLRIAIINKRTSFIISLLTPICILIIILKVMSASTLGMKVGVIDFDNSKTSNSIVNSLKEECNLNVISISKDEKDSRFAENDINVAIEIPKAYENKLLNNHKEKIIVTATEGDITKDLVEGIINAEILNISNIAEISEESSEIYAKSLDNYLNNEEISIGKKSLSDVHGDYTRGQFFIGFLIAFMIQRGMSGAKHVYEEKEQNVYTRIFMAPVRIWQYYLGDVLSIYLIILIQVLIGVISIKVFKIEIGIGSGVLFVILSLIGLVSVGISVCCRAFSENRTEFSNIFNFIYMMITMLGGCFVPIEIMPPVIEKISYFTPTRWAMQSIIDIQQGGSIKDIYKYLLVILLFAVAFFVIGGYKISREEKSKYYYPNKL